MCIYIYIYIYIEMVAHDTFNDECCNIYVARCSEQARLLPLTATLAASDPVLVWQRYWELYEARSIIVARCNIKERSQLRATELGYVTEQRLYSHYQCIIVIIIIIIIRFNDD